MQSVNRHQTWKILPDCDVELIHVPDIASPAQRSMSELYRYCPSVQLNAITDPQSYCISAVMSIILLLYTTYTTYSRSLTPWLHCNKQPLELYSLCQRVHNYQTNWMHALDVMLLSQLVTNKKFPPHYTSDADVHKFQVSNGLNRLLRFDPLRFDPQRFA